MLAEDETERAVEAVDPVVALVGAQVGLGLVVPRRKDELVRLDASRPPGEGEDDRTVAARDGSKVDPGVAGGGRVDELVQGDAVRASERQQLFQRGTAQPRLQPREVLVEMPVSAARSVSVMSRRCRSRLSRGPTASRVRSSEPSMRSSLPFGNKAC